MTTKEIEIDELSREQILDLADAEGKKLGFLLATSDLTDEVKQSILEIIQNATLEQIALLTDAFEQGYIASNNKALDEWFANRLKVIKFEANNEQEAADDKTIRAIDELEQKL